MTNKNTSLTLLVALVLCLYALIYIGGTRHRQTAQTPIVYSQRSAAHKADMEAVRTVAPAKPMHAHASF